jgi:BrnA antitoxin of type II toxin-antitoxin system
MRAEYAFSKGKRGAVIPQKGKTRISIFIDNAVLDAFRARAEQAGIGYQTMMNHVLKRAIAESDQPLTEGTLRQILREEMPNYVRRDVVKPSRAARKRTAG